MKRYTGISAGVLIGLIYLTIGVQCLGQSGEPGGSDEFFEAMRTLDLSYARTAELSNEQLFYTLAVQKLLLGEADPAMEYLDRAHSAAVSPEGKNRIRTLRRWAFVFAENWRSLSADSSGAPVSDMIAPLEQLNGAPNLSLYFSSPVVTVPMAHDLRDYPIISVTVNGMSRRFLLDLNAPISLITRSCARKSLIAPFQRIGTLNGLPKSVENPATLLDSIDINGLLVKNLPALIVSHTRLLSGMWNSVNLSNLDGVLGANFLRQINFELDFPGRTVTFRETDQLVGDTTCPIIWFSGPFIKLSGKNIPTRFLRLDPLQQASAILDSSVVTGGSGLPPETRLSIPMFGSREMSFRRIGHLPQRWATQDLPLLGAGVLGWEQLSRYVLQFSGNRMAVWVPITPDS